MKKIQYNVARAKTTELISQSGYVLRCLTDHPLIFPDPSPSLADWSAAIQNLKIKYTASFTRGKLDMKLYKVERERFNNLMRRMINYINGIAQQGSELDSAYIIACAGFDCNKDAHAVPAPVHIPSIKALMTGRSGVILVKAGPCKHARFYEFFISDKLNGKYELVIAQQQRNTVINGLESGKRYYFKVRAVNRSGASPFSNEVWMFAA